MDIDLTYLSLNERDFALDDISHALIRISEAIKRLIPGTKIILKNIRGTNTLKGMIAENVTYEELETTRNDLRAIIRGELTLDESYKHYKSILSGTLHLSLHALP